LDGLALFQLPVVVHNQAGGPAFTPIIVRIAAFRFRFLSFSVA
jgi:hypothetical protein